MKIGFIFPGYSSQFVGMGKDLYDESRVMQEYFEEAYNCLNINFIKLCFASSDLEISKITNAYPSIFLVSIALCELLKEIGIKPEIVAGHGIGQYAAIYTAGGFTFPDGLYLLKKYSSFFDENLINLDFQMLKIESCSTIKLNKVLKEYKDVQISAYNLDSHIISGTSADIEAIKSELKTDKIKTIKVDPGMGSYSNIMDDIVNQFTVYLEKVDFKDPNITLISSIDGKEIKTSKKIRENIIKQISMPIKFNKVIEKFKDMDVIIEVGPSDMFVNSIKELYPDKKVLSLNKKSDLEEIKNLLQNNNALNNVIDNIKIEETNVT